VRFLAAPVGGQTRCAPDVRLDLSADGIKHNEYCMEAVAWYFWFVPNVIRHRNFDRVLMVLFIGSIVS